MGENWHRRFSPEDIKALENCLFEMYAFGVGVIFTGLNEETKEVEFKQISVIDIENEEG